MKRRRKRQEHYRRGGCVKGAGGEDEAGEEGGGKEKGRRGSFNRTYLYFGQAEWDTIRFKKPSQAENEIEQGECITNC